MDLPSLSNGPKVRSPRQSWVSLQLPGIPLLPLPVAPRHQPWPYARRRSVGHDHVCPLCGPTTVESGPESFKVNGRAIARVGDTLGWLLETKSCDSSDKQKWREWVRSSESEPVYKPVGQVMSLASRASAARHKLVVGRIDAEHAAARIRLETQLVEPGTPMMIAAPDDRAIQAQNRRAVAGIEMTLAAPFVAIGTAMVAMAAAPASATAEATALVANAGGHSIRFKPFITAAKRVLAGGTLGGGAAMPAFAQPNTAASHSAVFTEDQETLTHWAEWNHRQQHQETTAHNYVLWEDLPETSND